MPNWVQIHGFSNYSVSDEGEVFNHNTDHFCSQSPGTGGGVRVNLMDDRGVPHTRSVKTLVAKAFLEPSENPAFETSMILNGDPWDIRPENLVWRPRWYVMKWAQQWDRKQPSPESYMGDRVYNQTKGIIYENIHRAGIADGVLWEHIEESIKYADPVLMLGYVYYWADNQ